MTGLGAVGVVIVTHNSVEHVAAALGALPTAELAGVVVVDNASSDGTAELVEALALPGVTVVREPNDGFGAGCNAGVAALPSTARRVLFLNPDAVIEPADLQRLDTYLEDHPTCALVVPRLFDGTTALHSAGLLITLSTELRLVLPHQLGRWFPDRRLPPDYAVSGRVGSVEGACMFVDRAALVAAGGFDLRYFLFFEESDLTRRLAKVGREVHLCAESSAQHAIGASRKGLPMSGLAEYYISAMRYLRRWRGPVAAATFQAAIVFSGLVNVARGRLSRHDAAAIRAAARTGWTERVVA